MKKIVFAMICVWLGVGVYAHTPHEKEGCHEARGRCNPNGVCTACSNCSACRHCSKNGGSCSVCSGGSTKKRYNYYQYYNTNSYKTIPSAYASDNLVGTTKTIYKTINLRERPSTKSAVLAKITPNDEIKIISKTGSWYYAEYEFYDYNWSAFRTLKGYIYSSLIK